MDAGGPRFGSGEKKSDTSLGAPAVLLVQRGVFLALWSSLPTDLERDVQYDSCSRPTPTVVCFGHTFHRNNNGSKKRETKVS